MKRKRWDLPKLTKQVSTQGGFGFQLRPSCLHPIQKDTLNLKSEIKKKQQSQTFHTVRSSRRLVVFFVVVKKPV